MVKVVNMEAQRLALGLFAFFAVSIIILAGIGHRETGRGMVDRGDVWPR
jgi:hypothetical protein